MMDPSENIAKLYGQKLRMRVCGLCLDEKDRLLMAKHTGLGVDGELWLPPGGGMEWGKSAAENLKREFKEETGLEIDVEDFLFVHEYLEGPLHAVELFFRTRIRGGVLSKGSDPEMDPDQQIISEVGFFSFEELQALGFQKLHAIFKHCNSLNELINTSGYFKFEK